MADERIDPAVRQDKWVVDHYARYLFASPLVAGRRALDVACGTGFGSHLLAEANAAHVLGADVAQDAVDYATAHYSHPRVTYVRKDILGLEPQEDGRFGLITCFETLEHVAEPQPALERLAALLDARSALIVSVPNEPQPHPHNPYHLSAFSQASFLALLQARFPYVTLYRQNYLLTSLVWRPTDQACETGLVQRDGVGVFHHGGEADDATHPDCFVAVCSFAPLDDLPAVGVQSGVVWRHHLVAEVDRLWDELQRVGKSWDEQKAHIDDQQATLARQQTAFTELEQQRDRLWDELQRVGKSWDEQKAHIDDQQATLARQQTAFTELEQQRDRLWDELQRVGKSWDEQKAHIDDQQATLARQQTAFTELEQQRDRLWDELQRVGKSWDEQKAYIDGQQAAFTELEQQRDRLWDELQRVGKSWEAQKAHIDDQQAYVAQVEHERSALRAERDQLLAERERQPLRRLARLARRTRPSDPSAV